MKFKGIVLSLGGEIRSNSEVKQNSSDHWA